MIALRLLTLTTLVLIASGCGKLATERAVTSAAKADSPGCPSEQIHVVGPVDVEGGETLIYEVKVCDRERYYEDATPNDPQRHFVRRKRPEGVAGNEDLWAETDGVATEEGAPPSSSGGEAEELDLGL